MVLRSEAQVEREETIPYLTSRRGQIVRALFVLSDDKVTDCVQAKGGVPPKTKTHLSTRARAREYRRVVSALIPMPMVLAAHCQCHSLSAVNKRRINHKGKIQSQLSWKSPRLQEIPDLSIERVARAGKQTRSSPRTTKTHQYVGQQQPPVRRRTLRASRKCQLGYVVDVIIYNADQRS